MKIKYYLQLLICIAGLLTACKPKNVDCVPEPSPPDYPFLLFTINLDNNTYNSGDIITVKMVMANVGSSDVIVKKRMIVNQLSSPDQYRDVSFLAIAPSRQALPFGAYITVFPPERDDFVTLSPGEVIEEYYDLQSVYAIDEGGKYILIAVYFNNMDPDDGRIAWKGELTSNIVIFDFEP